MKNKRSREEPRCGGNTFSAISALKSSKRCFPRAGVQGGAQMWGDHLFSSFSPEKLKKSDSLAPGSREELRCGGITFSAVSALKSSKR